MISINCTAKPGADDYFNAYLTANGGCGLLLEPIGQGARYPVRVLPDHDEGRAFVVESPRVLFPGDFRSLKVDQLRVGSEWRLTLLSPGDDLDTLPGSYPFELARVKIFDETYKDGQRVYLPNIPAEASSKRKLTVYDVSRFRSFSATCNAKGIASTVVGGGIILRAHMMASDDMDGAISQDYTPDADTNHPRELRQIQAGYSVMNPANGSVASVAVGETGAPFSDIRNSYDCGRWMHAAFSLTGVGPGDSTVFGEPSEVVILGWR